MAAGSIRVLDPVGKPRGEMAGRAPRIAGIGGKVLGLLSNGWRSFDAVVHRFSELAVEKYEARQVIVGRNPNLARATPKETMDDLARSDAAVVGLGH